jgi:hypothetical protein
MAEIYKLFNTAEDIVTDITTVSQPIWSENMNPWSASYAGSVGIGFYTSSAQITQAGNYMVQVYHRDPQTATNAEIQLAIAYGHFDGSGSVGDPNTVGQNINDTPSRAIYSQYRNLLLPPTDTMFSFNSSTDNPKDIMVINVARSRFRQKIDPGNWTLKLGSGSNWATSATSVVSFTDNSNASENPTINQAGRVFSILSGSEGTTVGTTVYGLFYPDAGIMVFDAAKLKSNLGIPIDSSSVSVLNNTQPRNHISMSMALKAASYFSARTEEQVNSTHYFVRVTNKQFNYSNNPTFVSGSTGTFRFSSMLRNPSVYITTVGMYDNNNRLLAVAKLSKPLLKTFNRETLIKVKLDY